MIIRVTFNGLFLKRLPLILTQLAVRLLDLIYLYINLNSS